MIVIGVDIGGGSIKGAAITSKGKILDGFTLPMDKEASQEVMFSRLADTIKNFIDTHKYEEEISGVGLGVPGILDKANGIVISSPNMPTWSNFNIVKYLSSKLNLPIKIVNDASAAALGEARFGSGKDYSNIIMLTLGTGVGGGIIINNELYDGYKGTGAQLGHALLELNGRECGCGRRGCLEAYASATALKKDTQKLIDENPDSILAKIATKMGKVNAKVAFDADRANCPLGHKLVTDYVMYLSEGILDYANIFRPDVFVLSGGVANEGEYLLSRIRKYLKDHDYGYKDAPIIKVEQARLGYDSGKVGAASLFFGANY